MKDLGIWISAESLILGDIVYENFRQKILFGLLGIIKTSTDIFIIKYCLAYNKENAVYKIS
jgi:hypothetical protein